MRASVLLLAVTASLSGQAQQPVSLSPALAEFKQKFARIEASSEDEATMALAYPTARKLVTYLKTHDLSAAQAKYIGLHYIGNTASACLRIYTWSVESGGTRGTVHHSVFQWRNAAGQRFAYATDEEGYFGEIHPLAGAGHQRYLLLGGDNGDSRCYSYKAWVVEIKSNYLLLDNAAFGKKALFELCNVPMAFDPRRQLLHLDLTDYSTEHDNVLLPEWGRPTGKSISLKFSNGRFVRSR